MNLIEKLGGYEAVKQAAVNYKNSGDRVTAAGLELQCLEYRRQHNIYEIGDKIVSTLNGDDDWKNAICEILAFHKKMAITTGFSCAIHHYHYRHATDAEIKAGRRLPVIESDDCSDIRNHISPNTVVIEG